MIIAIIISIIGVIALNVKDILKLLFWTESAVLSSAVMQLAITTVIKSKVNIDGIKIHMLHIIKDTALETLYNKTHFHVLSKDEYIDIVIKQLEYLDPKIVIERITGDPVKEDLIEPTWLIKKFCVLNDIDKEISLASLKIRLKNQEEVENPNNVKVITDLQNFAMYFSRSVIPFPRETSVEHLYYKHIGVYAFRKEALVKFANLEMTPLEISEKIEAIRYLEHGMKIKMIETDFIGVGIDVPEDLEKAREILSRDKS